jgi:hypothetical protein
MTEVDKNKTIPAYTIKLERDNKVYYYTFNTSTSYNKFMEYNSNIAGASDDLKNDVRDIFKIVWKKINENPNKYKTPNYIEDINHRDHYKQSSNYINYKNVQISKYFKFKDFISPNRRSKDNSIEKGEPKGRHKKRILKGIVELAQEIDEIQDFINVNKEFLTKEASVLLSDTTIKISSGYRCQDYQEEVNPEVTESRHVHYAAADMKIGNDFDNRKMLFVIVYQLASFGVITPGFIQWYPGKNVSHVHYDFGGREKKIYPTTLTEMSKLLDSDIYVNYNNEIIQLVKKYATGKEATEGYKEITRTQDEEKAIKKEKFAREKDAGRKVKTRYSMNDFDLIEINFNN